MEDRAHVMENVKTEALGDCVKEETAREHRTDPNPLEYVNVVIKSEYEECFYPELSCEPTLKQDNKILFVQSEECLNHSTELDTNDPDCRDIKTTISSSYNFVPFSEGALVGSADLLNTTIKVEESERNCKNNRKKCKVLECSKRGYKGGYCVAHGGSYYKYNCDVDGCSKLSLRGGRCSVHGGSYYRRQCKEESCSERGHQGGYCVAHGGTHYRRKCRAEGCSKNAQKGGRCAEHGGTCYRKKCRVKGCPKQAKRGGHCMSHGGAYYRYRCKMGDCYKQAKRGGVCMAHATFLALDK